MSKDKKIPQGDKAKLKFTLLVCNIFISALCIFAIVGYFVMPLWEVETSINVTPELVKMISPSDESSGDSSESESGDMTKDVISALGESGLSFSLSLTLDSSAFISAATGGDTKPFERIIESNVASIMQTLSDNIQNAIKPLMKSVVVTVIKEQVQKAVKETLEEGQNLDEETKQALEELGIDETFIEENIVNVVDALSADDATVESVSSAVMDVYDNVMSKIENSDEFGEEISEEDKAQMREEIEKSLNDVLTEIADEGGNIKIDDILNKLLLAALESGESGNESESEGGEDTASVQVRAYAPNVAYADGETSEEDATEQVKEKIMASLLEKMDEDTMRTIAKVMQVIGYVILFTFFTWAYLILKILLKIGAKNPGIKLKLPIWLGWIPYFILVLIPNAAIMAVKSGTVSGLTGEETETVTAVLQAVTLKFSSGALFSFIAAMILIVFSFVYGHYRRKLKKIIKYEKKNGIC